VHTVNDAAGVTPVVFWQLAFWPPDREIIVSSKRAYATKIMARLQILELHILTVERDAMVEPSAYTCTYPISGALTPSLHIIVRARRHCG
jgi:hypothetical protein